MGDKVLFEYRASEGGLQIGTLHGCCPQCSAERPWSVNSLKSSLEFLERIYGDLYGDREADGSSNTDRALC